MFIHLVEWVLPRRSGVGLHWVKIIQCIRPFLLDKIWSSPHLCGNGFLCPLRRSTNKTGRGLEGDFGVGGGGEGCAYLTKSYVRASVQPQRAGEGGSRKGGNIENLFVWLQINWAHIRYKGLRDESNEVSNTVVVSSSIPPQTFLARYCKVGSSAIAACSLDSIEWSFFGFTCIELTGILLPVSNSVIFCSEGSKSSSACPPFLYLWQEKEDVREDVVYYY